MHTPKLSIAKIPETQQEIKNLSSENVSEFNPNLSALKSNHNITLTKSHHRRDNVSFSSYNPTNNLTDFDIISKPREGLFTNDALRKSLYENSQKSNQNTFYKKELTLESPSTKNNQYTLNSESKDNVMYFKTDYPGMYINSTQSFSNFDQPQQRSFSKSNKASNETLKIPSSKSPDLIRASTPRITPDLLGRSTARSNKVLDISPSKGSYFQPTDLNISMLSSTNLRESRVSSNTSFVNAMKALQQKIKKLEKCIEDKDIQLEKKEKEVENLKGRIIEERQSNTNLESNLRNRVEILEKELNDKNRLTNNLNEENHQLRDIINQNNREIENLIIDKTNLRNRINDLENRLENQMLLTDQAKKSLLEVNQENNKLADEINFLHEKLYMYEKEKKDLKLNFDEQLNHILLKNKHMEDKLIDMKSEYDNDLNKKNQKERLLNEEINNLKKEVDDYRISKQELDHYLKEKQRELASRDQQIMSLKEEIKTMNKEIEIMKMYAYNYENNIIQQQIIHPQNNDNLIIDTIKNKNSHNEEQSKFENDILDKRLSNADKSDRISPKLRITNPKNSIYDDNPVETYPPLPSSSYKTEELRLNLSSENLPPLKNSRILNNKYESYTRTNSELGGNKYLTSSGMSISTSRSKKNSVTWADNESDNLGLTRNLYYSGYTGPIRTKDLFNNLSKPPNPISHKKIDQQEEEYNNIDQERSNYLSDIKPKFQSRMDNSSSSQERREYEIVIKDIIKMEKNILDLNKKYKNTFAQMTGKDDQQIKKELSDLLYKLQQSNEELIKLKIREEELLSRFNFTES